MQYIKIPYKNNKDTKNFQFQTEHIKKYSKF